MGISPGDTDIGATGRRQPRAEAVRTYVWVGRMAAAAWLLGGILAITYIVSLDGISTRGLIMLGASLVGLIATLIVPWGRAERWWIAPLAAYAMVVIAVATAWLDKPGITAFHLFPLLFMAYLFWGKPKVIVPTCIAWSVLFVGAEVLRPGPISPEQLIVALPTYIAAAAMVGVLANRFRDLSRSERRRFKATVDALCTALSARDGYTGEHSAETLALVVAVMNELELAPEQTELVSDIALLHDIGKIGIPNDILHSPGRLDDDQWEVMKQHPVIGERIVAAIPGLESVAKAIRHEHERWDGLGYPDGLKGNEIPLGSRIVLVCDAYHAMTSDRPYRKALPEHEARAELVRNAGTQFDPVVVGALLAALGRTTGARALRRADESVAFGFAFPGSGELVTSA